MTTHRYRLLKGMPDGSVPGDFFIRIPNSDRYQNERFAQSKSPVIEHIFLFTWQVENNPEWFELVEDRIEVEVAVGNYVGKSIKFKYPYCYFTTEIIPLSKLESIRNAIEGALNDDND